jgi:hypothetical protein
MIILPSLEIVPAKYNGSTLLSQIPIDGTGDFTVTRATSPTTGQSTRVNALGLIETVADNVPRLDYPIGGGCPALLVEPAAQNFVPSGTAFNSSTGINYANVSSSPAVGISGTVISKTNTAAGSQYASQNCLTALPSGSTNYTISRFFKYNGTDITTSLEFNNTSQWGGIGWRQLINIDSTGVTLGTSASCTGSVENYGDGWYRVIVKLTTGASPSGASPVVYLMVVSGTVASGGSFLTALPQLETGLVATSYINTTAGSITRAADVITDATASGVIGQTQGTIYAEVVFSNASAGAIFLLDNGSTSTFLNISRTTGQNVQVSLRNGGGSIATIITSSALANGVHKVALSYTNGAYSLYINGLPAGTSTDSTNYPASLTSASICSLNYGAPYFPRNDRIRAAALYPTRLTDTQLALLTSPYTSYSSMASALSYTLG